VIIFRRLAREDVIRIVDIQMSELSSRLEEQGLSIELSDEAKAWLAAKGYDPVFGARPLRRTIQRFVESPLSGKLLKGEFQRGDVVVVKVSAKGESLSFDRTTDAEADEESAETAVSEDQSPAMEDAVV
jgi:ATP-dependent Clp protease ATP-binding subunit ClpA